MLQKQKKYITKNPIEIAINSNAKMVLKCMLRNSSHGDMLHVNDNSSKGQVKKPIVESSLKWN